MYGYFTFKFDASLSTQKNFPFFHYVSMSYETSATDFPLDADHY